MIIKAFCLVGMCHGNPELQIRFNGSVNIDHLLLGPYESESKQVEFYFNSSIRAKLLLYSLGEISCHVIDVTGEYAAKKLIVDERFARGKFDNFYYIGKLFF